MKKVLVKGLVFLAANALFFFVHIQLFQSPVPYLMFGSMAVHITALVLFPYEKFLNTKNKSK